MVSGLNRRAIDQPQPQLPLAQPRAGAGQARRQVALEALLRERAGVAEQAEPALPVGTMARPRAASPGAPVSGAGMASPTTMTGCAAAAPPRSEQRREDPPHAFRRSVCFSGSCADALAGRGEDRVQHRRRRDRDRRLADAAPEAAGRHDDGLDLRHLVHAASPGRCRNSPARSRPSLTVHLAVERRRQAIDEGALDLRLDLLRVDRMAADRSPRRCGGSSARRPSLTETSAHAAT